MLDYSKLREALKGLLTEKSSKEDIDAIASISKEVDNLEASAKKQEEEHNKLKSDYIEVVKNYGFKGEEKTIHEEEAPKSLEDIASAVIKKRSDDALHRK